MKTRKEFLKGTAMVAGMAAASGCRTGGLFCGTYGAPMQGYVAPRLKRIRVGVVGIGSRGTSAVSRLAVVPGVEVVAVADVAEEAIVRAKEALKKLNKPDPRVFFGEEGWKALCDWDGIDAVYNTTPWHLHVPVALRAMRAGKHAFVEVPSAFTVDECWELVETSEKTRRYCMQLENCCYGEEEMLALNMCRLGLFGTLVHGEAAYIHEMRHTLWKYRWNNWRVHWNKVHKGNQYPTHGLGPVSQYMNINRGDRYDHLVSLESNQFALEEWAKEQYPAGDWTHNVKIDMGDMNVTMIKTVLGRSIMVQHDVVNPRPYSRLNLIQGTKGMLMGYPLRIYIDGQMPIEYPDEPLIKHHAFDEKKTQEYRELYKHPLWKRAGELATKVGGHGGQDFLMDLRWSYCLMHGEPLDTDVYDLAAWCSIAGLSEKSVRSGSSAVTCPDFTRGAWRAAKPFGIVDVKI